jgi:polysaccharide biosynthesis protein PslH
VEVLTKPIRLLNAAGNFLAGRPVSFGFFHSRKFDEGVRQALRRRHYDVIFVYCSSMGPSVPLPAPAPVVVDFVDADSQKFSQYAARSGFFRRWLYEREARTVAAAERSLGRMAALSFAVTEHDARELTGGNQGFTVEVVPNGVEVPDVPVMQDQSELREQKPFSLFVGTMDYPPNSDAAAYFARDILPLVRKAHPDLKFVIVGRDPDRRVRELASIPGVVVKGTVPDVFQYFRSAEVSVAPFRISQGFHNKIAESLAVGTPVITTSRAMAGIGLGEHEGLFVADAVEEFADKVSSVLSDIGLRRTLRDAAPVVRQRLSWDARLCRLEQLIVQGAAKRVKPSPELVTES